MAACNCAAHSLIISASDLPLRESALLDYAFETGGVGMITEKLALPYQYKQEIAENLTALVDLLRARYGSHIGRRTRESTARIVRSKFRFHRLRGNASAR